MSLVGYTNAGKSTLFNALTHRAPMRRTSCSRRSTPRRAGVHTANGDIVLSDTVGFIRHLPHTLVEAFRATLEETVQADLLLHVVDASSPDREAQMREVNQVLAEIGADRVRQILVFNKIDLTGPEPGVERDDCGRISRVRLSARPAPGSSISELRSSSSHRPRARPCRRAAWKPREPAARFDPLRTTPHPAPEYRNLKRMALNDPQWGKRRGDGPPDLDEIWARFNQKLSGMFGGKGRPPSPEGGGGGRGFKSFGNGPILLVGLVIVVWIASGFYIVDAGSAGVVLRFGKSSSRPSRVRAGTCRIRSSRPRSSTCRGCARSRWATATTSTARC